MLWNQCLVLTLVPSPVERLYCSTDFFLGPKKIIPKKKKKAQWQQGGPQERKNRGVRGVPGGWGKKGGPPQTPEGAGGSPLRGFGGSRTRQELLSDGPWSLILRICDHKSPRICTAGLMRAEEFLFLSGLTWWCPPQKVVLKWIAASGWPKTYQILARTGFYTFLCFFSRPPPKKKNPRRFFLKMTFFGLFQLFLIFSDFWLFSTF